MPEQDINSFVQFKDTVNKILIGDTRQNALNFIQHLALLEMTIKLDDDGGGGRVFFNGKTVCDIWLRGGTDYPGPWTVWMYWTETKSVPNDERLMEITWANVGNCHNCPGGNNEWCRSDKKKTIFGRDFDNVCQAAIAFTDPNAKVVECAKKLMEMRKLAIDILEK